MTQCLGDLRVLQTQIENSSFRLKNRGLPEIVEPSQVLHYIELLPLIIFSSISQILEPFPQNRFHREDRRNHDIASSILKYSPRFLQASDERYCINRGHAILGRMNLNIQSGFFSVD